MKFFLFKEETPGLKMKKEQPAIGFCKKLNYKLHNSNSNNHKVLTD